MLRVVDTFWTSVAFSWPIVATAESTVDLQAMARLGAARPSSIP